MSFSNQELVRHILDETNFILQHTAGKSKEEVTQNDVLSRAIIRSLEIIGEASRKIDNEFKASHPETEWKKMSGTRDRLIHHYLGVDYDIDWNIIKEKLPLLREQMGKILQGS